MPVRPQHHRPPSDGRKADAKRGTARQRGYDTRWDKARKTFLASHPLCIMCRRDGYIVPATVVDHITPHRGDRTLFWDITNWQPLCATHHNSTKQRIEARGYIFGCDASGRPVDPQHPWNRKG